MSRKRAFLAAAGLVVVLAGTVAGLVVTTGSARSAGDLRAEAVAAVEDLGPVSVEAIDEMYMPDGSARSVEVRQLVDRTLALSRTTVRKAGSDELVSDSSVIGGDVVFIDYDLPYVTRSSHLEPPAELLTIWGGYEELLRNGRPLQAADSPEGLRRLFMEFDHEGGTGHYVVSLKPDGLPVSVEVYEGGFGQEGRVQRKITYRVILSARVSVADVTITEIPGDPVVTEDHEELPLSEPVLSGVSFGQYWLGQEWKGRRLVHAERLGFSPRTDYEPTGVDGLLLMYAEPGGGDRNRDTDVQMMVQTRDSEAAKRDMATYEAEADGVHLLKLEREVAGQSAIVYLQTVPDNPDKVIHVSVYLADAVVDINASLWPSKGDVDELLSALRSLRG